MMQILISLGQSSKDPFNALITSMESPQMINFVISIVWVVLKARSAASLSIMSEEHKCLDPPLVAINSPFASCITTPIVLFCFLSFVAPSKFTFNMPPLGGTHLFLFCFSSLWNLVQSLQLLHQFATIHQDQLHSELFIFKYDFILLFPYKPT